MKNQSFRTRVATIVDAVEKALPTDSSLGIRKTGKGDGLDLLVDAIEGLLRRFHESLTAFQSAQRAMLELQIPGDSSARKELSREHILLLGALQANMPDTIYFKDAQSRFLHLSKAHAKAFNLVSEEKVVGKTDFDFLLPEHAREAFNDEQRIIRTGEPIINKEEKETWPDRPATWVLTTKMPLRDEQGAVVGTFGISRDITDRKRAEEKLRRSEERYRLLFNSINDAILIHEFHDDGSAEPIVEVNDIACVRLEYAREELLGMTMQEITLPEALAVDSAAEGRFRTKGNLLYERMHLGKSGRKIPVEISNRLFELDGKPMIFATVRDITERKRVEKALRDSEEKYRNLIEVAHEGILVVENAKVIFFNNRLLEMLGYSREEMMDMEIARLIYKDDVSEAMERYAARAAGELIPKVIFRDVRKDGRVIWVEAVGQRIEWEGRTAVLYFTSDITERKNLEEQFAQAQKMEAIGQLTGGIAHDFNNVLQVIMGYCEILAPSLLEESKKYVEQITVAAEKAAALTTQLLAFSRKQVLRPQVVDTKDLILSMQKMLERVIGEDIELRTFIDPKTGNFLADPGKMEQVLMNLAVNARDAMPSGGKLTIETANRTFDETYVHDHPGAKAGEYVRISVSDTGVGIDQETLSHIFEPFFTTKERGKGTGLGLSTVYGIVKQSEGYVNCYSEMGKGTTFTIYLPLAREEADKPLVQRSGTTTPTGKETILIVDDDKAVRSVVRIALEGAGYVVIEASDGEEALSDILTRGAAVELLISDIVMPRMSGKELARRLKEIFPKVRVLYASGYTGNVISQHGIFEAGLDFLQKPFSSIELLSKVREILDRP
jgi:PAS domain S-box-containing protein